ncbi:unnamed protein product [Meganyctiphanes norvegica]|uniref:Oplophorus-luciferin 2-monooxygenase non-catalytic subunit n=1 Tax=Meganyctiphanes norvegica TaxID=48144 RepID=A0AAV2SCR8_MEGNR
MRASGITLLHAVAVCVSTYSNVSGNTQGKQKYTPSNAYNPSKTQVIQDRRHQPEYCGYEEHCPDAEDIHPCVCTYYNEVAMDLECSGLEGEDQLRQVFSADFPIKNFRRFIMYSNNNLKVLESSVFNGISFEWISIEQSQLEVIEMHAFDSCYETTTYIRLLMNNITSFPFDDLFHFSKLSYFALSNNLLDMIPANAFNGLSALETLDLEYTTSNFVGTFENLPNLRSIFLEHNDLTDIPGNFIKAGSYNLRYIYLNSNSIVSVEPGAFDIVAGLEFYIYGNSLSTLDEATWRSLLEAGGVLDPRYNPLICGCDVAWLFGEDQLLNQTHLDTSCSDGQYLHRLDPSSFDNC